MGRNSEGNQRGKEGYHPADSRETVEVKSKETKCLKRGSIATRMYKSAIDRRPYYLRRTRKLSGSPLIRKCRTWVCSFRKIHKCA